MKTQSTIRPGIIVDGETIYPTGLEWLLAFAIRGFPWAIKALAKYKRDEVTRWLGENI